jgi:heme-degrading monooxygenase HmoA
MWAQVQRLKTHPGKESQVLELFDQLRAIEPEDSGLQQTLVLRSQSDPTELVVVVVFESEEKARIREKDPRRQAGLQPIRAILGDVLNGPPEFTDSDVVLSR